MPRKPVNGVPVTPDGASSLRRRGLTSVQLVLTPDELEILRQARRNAGARSLSQWAVPVLKCAAARQTKRKKS